MSARADTSRAFCGCRRRMLARERTEPRFKYPRWVARVQVDMTYTLRARAPGFRLANKGTVTFTSEQFWEASRRLEEPPSSSEPVVVDLELLMEPATCELALDVNNDDCTLTLERPGLPDLSLERGSQVVEGLPAATVSTVVRASLKGHAQLKPLEPITLAAAQKHAVSVELRPATVFCKCIDARTGAELVNARVRYEADGTVQYGSRRAPVVVDPATYRGCVIVEGAATPTASSGTTASPWSWILKDCAAPMMSGQNSSGDPHLPTSTRSTKASYPGNARYDRVHQ